MSLEARLEQLTTELGIKTSPVQQRVLEIAARGAKAEEPAGILCGRPKKVIPYIPYYKAEPNEVLAMWTEEFVDRAGNEATLTWVRFRNKKKPGSEPNEAVIQVKWKKQFAYLDK